MKLCYNEFGYPKVLQEWVAQHPEIYVVSIHCIMTSDASYFPRPLYTLWYRDGSSEQVGLYS